MLCFFWGGGGSQVTRPFNGGPHSPVAGPVPGPAWGGVPQPGQDRGYPPDRTGVSPTQDRGVPPDRTRWYPSDRTGGDPPTRTGVPHPGHESK